MCDAMARVAAPRTLVIKYRASKGLGDALGNELRAHIRAAVRARGIEFVAGSKEEAAGLVYLHRASSEERLEWPVVEKNCQYFFEQGTPVQSG